MKMQELFQLTMTELTSFGSTVLNGLLLKLKFVTQFKVNLIFKNLMKNLSERILKRVIKFEILFIAPFQYFL